MSKSTYVVTGATSGLGLETVRLLAKRIDGKIIVGARSPDKARQLRNAVPAGQLRVFPLDTSSLASVRQFCETVRNEVGDTLVDGLICIAGIQILGSAKLTEDGVDETFAANYLGHFALVRGLEDCLAAGATVVTIGSGTHNPKDPIASRFGFRGADFPDAESVALGQSSFGGNEVQRGMDRYATSKLCAILHVLDLGETVPSEKLHAICFDPGLMPGTDLARERSGVERFVWRYLMPVLQYFVPGVSSKKRSARALVEKVILAASPLPTGTYVEFSGSPPPQAAIAKRKDIAKALRLVSERLISAEETANEMVTQSGG